MSGPAKRSSRRSARFLDWGAAAVLGAGAVMDDVDVVDVLCDNVQPSESGESGTYFSKEVLVSNSAVSDNNVAVVLASTILCELAYSVSNVSIGRVSYLSSVLRSAYIGPSF